MKKLNVIVALLLGLSTVGASAQEKYLHVYQTNKEVVTNQKTTYYPDGSYRTETYSTTYGKFNSYPYSLIDSISFQLTTNGKHRMRVHHHTDGVSTSKLFNIANVGKWTVGPDVPKFYIKTVLDGITEVTSKETYLDATLTIDGGGVYDDFTGEIKIRGRGNSTWNQSKKPYRIKLPEKTKLCGYRKTKNYVLLANYLDMSFMRNEVACLATQYVDADFPTHATPVDVYFNDIYKGSYMLIEKVGINNGSVNMPAEQEAESCMFQLDVSYDEDYKMQTEIFNLPLMHKDPDLPDDPTEAKQWFEEWCADFAEMEAAVASGDQRAEYLDYTSLAKYLLVYNLACNQEINYPKSTYMYKTRGGKWQFGPAWDFDWAFGYSPHYKFEDEGEYTMEELDRMYDEAVEIARKELGYSMGYISYNGQSLFWTGYSFYDTDWNYWPYSAYRKYVPSYQNYLFGTGSNHSGLVNGDYDLGNGGEFFLSMIIDNPEFMEVYKGVWEEFQANLSDFWADFETYADALEPSAARNHTVWWLLSDVSDPVDSEFSDVVDKSYVGAINQLRLWLQKRLEFMADESKNYGLYDPNTYYERGSRPHYVY